MALTLNVRDSCCPFLCWTDIGRQWSEQLWSYPKGHWGQSQGLLSNWSSCFWTVGLSAQSGPHRFQSKSTWDSLEGQIVFWNIVGPCQPKDEYTKDLASVCSLNKLVAERQSQSYRFWQELTDLNRLVHFQNKISLLNLLIPISSKRCMSFFLQSKISFLRKTCQDFFSI